MENSLPFYVSVDESDNYLFTVKNLPATQEPLLQSLSQEAPVMKEMATLSSILAWRIPWTEEPGTLQPMGSQSPTQLSTHAGTLHLGTNLLNLFSDFNSFVIS